MKTYRLLALVLFIGTFAFGLHAEETAAAPSTGDLRLGAFALTNVNVHFRLSSPANPNGSDLDFVDHLGGDSSANVFRADARWNFAAKHALDASWYDIDLSGSRTLSFDVQFGDKTYTLGTTVTSQVRTNFYKIAYGYTFLRRDHHEFTGLIGAHVVKLQSGIAATGIGQSERFSVTAPLPSLGLEYKTRWSDRITSRVAVQYFGISAEDEYSGRFIDALVAIEYSLTKRAGIGGGYNRFDLDADFESGARTLNVRYTYDGLLVYGFVRF